MIEQQLIGPRDDQAEHGEQLSLSGRVENHFESLDQIEDVALGVVHIETVDELLSLEVTEQQDESVVEPPDVRRERTAAGTVRVQRYVERNALQISAHSYNITGSQCIIDRRVDWASVKELFEAIFAYEQLQQVTGGLRDERSSSEKIIRSMQSSSNEQSISDV